jgi:enoyl-[acyl-carrier-protein] reductase (NADH)
MRNQNIGGDININIVSKISVVAGPIQWRVMGSAKSSTGASFHVCSAAELGADKIRVNVVKS